MLPSPVFPAFPADSQSLYPTLLYLHSHTCTSMAAAAVAPLLAVHTRLILYLPPAPGAKAASKTRTVPAKPSGNTLPAVVLTARLGSMIQPYVITLLPDISLSPGGEVQFPWLEITMKSERTFNFKWIYCLQSSSNWAQNYLAQEHQGNLDKYRCAVCILYLDHQPLLSADQ
jgi:hypothetical protein